MSQLKSTNNTDYQERAAYDPNGNIKTYIRHGFGSATESMDSLIYNYTTGTNKLSSITDGTSATNYTTDIKTQAANNYTYNSNSIQAGDTLSTKNKISEHDTKDTVIVLSPDGKPIVYPNETPPPPPPVDPQNSR